MRKMFNDVSQFIKTTTREVGGNASTIQMLRPSNTTSALGRPNHGLYFYRNTQKSGIVSSASNLPHTPPPFIASLSSLDYFPLQSLSILYFHCPSERFLKILCPEQQLVNNFYYEIKIFHIKLIWQRSIPFPH